MVLTFLILLMGLAERTPDSLSLNGELFSVALMTLLFLQLSKKRDALQLLIEHAWTVLVVYTKVQSVILLLLLAYKSQDNKERLKMLLILGACILLVEAILYSNGIGLIRNATDLFTYVTTPTQVRTISAERQGLFEAISQSRFKMNLRCAVDWIMKFVPMFGFVVGHLFLTNQKSSRSFWQIGKIGY